MEIGLACPGMCSMMELCAVKEPRQQPMLLLLRLTRACPIWASPSIGSALAQRGRAKVGLRPASPWWHALKAVHASIRAVPQALLHD